MGRRLFAIPSRHVPRAVGFRFASSAANPKSTPADTATMDNNSGQGPLRVPGFGGIPVHFQLPAEARFAHGFCEWRQSPIVTMQERAMVAVMNRLTDKPGWSEAVFDDAVVAQWRAELDVEREQTRNGSRKQPLTEIDALLANPRLLKDSTWAWCVQELRDKARDFSAHGHVRVLDTGSCVCKADSAALGSISEAMQRAVVPLVDEYDADQERQASRAKRADRAKRNVAGAEVSEQSKDRQIDGQEDTSSSGSAADSPAGSPAVPSAGSTAAASQVADAQSVPDASDVLNVIDSNTAVGTDEDLIEFLDDGSYYPDIDDGRWLWEPSHGGKPLDIDGSTHMIRSLVDPLLFPLLYGRTPVLQQSGAVALNNVLAWYGATETAPQIDPAKVVWDVLQNIPDGTYANVNAWSSKHQRLPCEVTFVPGGGASGTDVLITSYINGVHPENTNLYTAVEQVLSRCIRLWNDCLVQGHRGAYDYEEDGQLGRIPLRILTYGVQWENELPPWVSAFCVPPSRRPAVGSSLPPLDSDLWSRAREYLERPGCADPDGWLADWAPGDKRTWDLLLDKARRLVGFKHPEAGTAFSYNDWKTGCHENRAIVDKAPPRHGRSETSKDGSLPTASTVTDTNIALQDRFRTQGLQVLVEINSIELSPDTPAYAPDAAERTAAYAERAITKLATALANNSPIDQNEQPDEDGWRLSGCLNDHVAAVAVFVFDADNVTAPRLGFRQRMGQCLDQYWYRSPGGNNGYRSGISADDFRLTGRLLQEPDALAEVVDVPRGQLFAELAPSYQYQHTGSVSLLSPSSGESPPAAQGRLVAFPNTIEHRLELFRLIDATRPGRLRWLTLHLVDPHYRICSTRNAPPQQHSWWAAPVRRALASQGIPAEIIDMVLLGTGEWPIGMDEALRHRAEVDKEVERVRKACEY